MDTVSPSQESQEQKGIGDPGEALHLVPTVRDGFNWKLPFFGAIGFGVSFAIMAAIMVTIYNIAHNAFASALSTSRVGVGVGVFRGIIVGAVGGAALGLAYKDKKQAYYFSLFGATGFAIAFALVISLPDITPDLGRAIIRFMGGPGILSDFETSLAHGLGIGAIVGSIGGMGLGLASSKGRMISALLLGFTGAVVFANVFAFGDTIFDGNLYSSWNAWGGALGGAAIGLALAVHNRIMDSAHTVEKKPAQAIDPALAAAPGAEAADTASASAAETPRPIFSAVNRVGYWSGLLTTAAAAMLSMISLILILVFRGKVVSPEAFSFFNLFFTSLSILQISGFIVLMACIAKSAPPANFAWPWLGVGFAVLAAVFLILQVSPLSQYGPDFRILALPGLAGSPIFLLLNAIFTSLACLCALPVFRTGLTRPPIRTGLLIYAGAVLITSLVGALGEYSALMSIIKMAAQMVVFPLTTGLVTVLFRRARKMNQRLGWD